MPHQLTILQALDRGVRNILWISHRRSGKDFTIWNYCIRECIKNPITVYYCLPTYSQAKKVIFDALDHHGVRFLDYIPPEVIDSINSQEQKIRFINGSLLQLIGSDTYNTSLVGTNPKIIVFSEYALADFNAFLYARPILNFNKGTCIVVSTPRGKNHLYELYAIAKDSPDWYTQKTTIEDTNMISSWELDRERQHSSEELIQQEYYCSFDRGVEGSFYGRYLDRLRLNNQISTIPWESSYSVNTAWDIGLRDSTTILFYQVIGETIRLIDYYANANEGLEHYVNVVKSKPYTYNCHIAPHDMRVREFSSGVSRLEKASTLGIDFIIAPDHSLVDGIEKVRSSFNRLYIDDQKCAKLIKSLENYRKEYDLRREVYSERPLHNWASHAADALRYLCVSLPIVRTHTTADDIDKYYHEARYGNNFKVPAPFRDPYSSR